MLASALRVLNPKIAEQLPALSCIRTKTAYEGEGKTTVQILNQDTQDGLMIKAYSTYGFRLSNNITVLGPLAIFHRTILSWQVEYAKDITLDHLKFFALLEPKLDLLVLGLETKDRKVCDNIRLLCRQLRLNAEILTTANATATFNFMNSDGRCVAAALIPPTRIDVNEDDMLRARLHYGNLYETSSLE